MAPISYRREILRGKAAQNALDKLQDKNGAPEAPNWFDPLILKEAANVFPQEPDGFEQATNYMIGWHDELTTAIGTIQLLAMLEDKAPHHVLFAFIREICANTVQDI